MNKENIFELQKIDSNCNDCKYMSRDFERYDKSKKFHYDMQIQYFNIIKEKTEDESMKFQFDESFCSIKYGHCTKLNKPVSFIPNTCQLETQECFKHRKE